MSQIFEMAAPSLDRQILFVTHKYPPSIGGMQTQSFELIKYAKRKMTVSSIIYRSNYPKILFLLSVTFKSFWKVLGDSRISLVHANDGLMALFLTPLLLVRRVKLCATVHGLDVVFNFSPYRWWVKRYLSKFAFLVAVSEATLEECVKIGIPKHKIHFIPNAVELPDKVGKDAEFKNWIEETYQVSLENKLIIASVGRPVPRKGFGWFAKNVLPHIPNSVYLVVGTAMESRGVILFLQKILPSFIFEQLCKMLGVPLDAIVLIEIAGQGNRLVLLNKISKEELFQTYLHTDIFVMPNLCVKGDFEGFGLVALEAGAFGAICLAANVDGIPSAVKDGVNGFLLESGKPNVWINKINELADQDKHNAAKRKFEAYYNTDQMTWDETG
ncbi:MAG: glycosyltransferase family 4 protein, partial [Ekhidna sp.]|nr:glycosyltransferase family 4 protein [Ekhidna sp.]